MGNIEKMFDSNKKESSIKKNEYEKLINFVEDFKTTFTRSNLLKNSDLPVAQKIDKEMNRVLDSYKECMGEGKVSSKVFRIT